MAPIHAWPTPTGSAARPQFPLPADSRSATRWGMAGGDPRRGTWATRQSRDRGLTLEYTSRLTYNNKWISLFDIYIYSKKTTLAFAPLESVPQKNHVRRLFENAKKIETHFTVASIWSMVSQNGICYQVMYLLSSYVFVARSPGISQICLFNKIFNLKHLTPSSLVLLLRRIIIDLRHGVGSWNSQGSGGRPARSRASGLMAGLGASGSPRGPADARVAHWGAVGCGVSWSGCGEGAEATAVAHVADGVMVENVRPSSLF